MKFCPYCGAGLEIAASFCPECGKRLSGVPKRVRKKSSRNVKIPQSHPNPVESEEETVPEQDASPRETELECEELETEDHEDPYDGYYDDILPPDMDRGREGPDMELIRKIFLVAGGVLLVIALCLAALYFL